MPARRIKPVRGCSERVHTLGVVNLGPTDPFNCPALAPRLPPAASSRPSLGSPQPPVLRPTASTRRLQPQPPPVAVFPTSSPTSPPYHNPAAAGLRKHPQTTAAKLATSKMKRLTTKVVSPSNVHRIPVGAPPAVVRRAPSCAMLTMRPDTVPVPRQRFEQVF